MPSEPRWASTAGPTGSHPWDTRRQARRVAVVLAWDGAVTAITCAALPVGRRRGSVSARGAGCGAVLLVGGTGRLETAGVAGRGGVEGSTVGVAVGVRDVPAAVAALAGEVVARPFSPLEPEQPPRPTAA